MYFLSNIYRNVKLAVATVGGIGAIITIIYGAVSSGGTVFIVGGSVWLVQTGFNFFDSSKAQIDIKKQVKKLEKNLDVFSKENEILKGNIGELQSAKDEYVRQNIKLAQNFEKSDKQIEKLAKLKEQYEAESKQFQIILEEEKNKLNELEDNNIIYIQQNDRLKHSLEKMKKIEEKIKFGTDELNKLLEENKQQIEELKKIKDVYIKENEKLQKTNKKNEIQLQFLQKQIKALQEINQESINLVLMLKEGGDDFKDFNRIIGENIVEIKDAANNLDTIQENFNDNLDVFKNLVIKLKNTLFSQIDKNND